MKKKMKVIIGIYVAAVLVYLGVLGYSMISDARERRELAQLAEMTQQATTAATTTSTEPLATESTLPTEPEPTRSPDEKPQILMQYQALYEKNPDVAGWLKIGDTVIDYPVMYTPQDPEYYLNRDFDGNDSKRGLLFVDFRSNIWPMSTNVMIHGHNMKDGSMFSALRHYASESFFNSHQTIQFDTIYETGTYEVFAVLVTELIPATQEGFRYYTFYDAADQLDFDSYISDLRVHARFTTNVVPEYGDQLLSLSTCSYHVPGDKGRIVVFARRISQGGPAFAD
jgi:sortase B